MKLFLIILFLIKINYPDDTYETKVKYDNLVQEVAAEYSFLGIDFEITEDESCADLIVNPGCYFIDFRTLGFMRSTIHRNVKIHGTPVMFLSAGLDSVEIRQIIKHEFGHYLGLPHSLDTQSVMWEYYERGTSFGILTRNDSILLMYFLNEFKINKCQK